MRPFSNEVQKWSKPSAERKFIFDYAEVQPIFKRSAKLQKIF